ncbi:MAG: LysM peptidoglycan-binding domain-containing protein [Acetatifactor sp.]|nr:LysM peptidoglycan-binding domain-containing protein [Acetatifactor sp.]
MFLDLGEEKCRRCLCLIWTGLLATAFFLICSDPMAARAATEQQQAESVEEFVRSFYESCAEGEIDVIWECMEDDGFDQVHRQALAEILPEYGFQGYDILMVNVYPLREADWWVATVAYDMLVEGIDSPLPGWESLLIQMPEGDSGLIFNVADPSMGDEILQILETAEIRDMSNDINKRFNEIVMQHPEILEWINELEQAVTLRAVDLVSGETMPKKSDEKFYVVQKGDCLWHIAEDRLGDGARWGELYEVNKNIIGEDPNLLLTGMELQLP